jgi:hypothetical protein
MNADEILLLRRFSPGNAGSTLLVESHRYFVGNVLKDTEAWNTVSQT